MKTIAILLALLLAAPAAALTVHTVRKPATREDQRPNDPKVPDAYAITAKFDRIVVMRIKNKADLLTGMEKLVKSEKIRNGVILSGIGSLRGYSVHNVASRDYPVADVFTADPKAPADLIGVNGLIVNGVIHAHVMMAIGEKAQSYAGHLEKGSEVLTFAIITVGVLDKDLGRVDDATYR
jgi:predicted DNA-binding protein with PD1-like motif